MTGHYSPVPGKSPLIGQRLVQGRGSSSVSFGSLTLARALATPTDICDYVFGNRSSLADEKPAELAMAVSQLESYNVADTYTSTHARECAESSRQNVLRLLYNALDQKAAEAASLATTGRISEDLSVDDIIALSTRLTSNPNYWISDGPAIITIKEYGVAVLNLNMRKKKIAVQSSNSTS